MFTRFTSLLVLVAPLASALTLNTPTNVNNGERVDITWTAVPTDVPFTLELVNPVFNSQFAIANNVDPADGSRTWQVPTVPVGSDYVINACNIFNISDVYASTSEFAIGALSSSTGTTSTGVTSTGASTGTSINTGSPTANSLPVTSSTLIVTPVGSGTGTANTGAANTGTSSATTASTLPTSAAVSSRLALTNACGYALLLLSIVGGAVTFAL